MAWMNPYYVRPSDVGDVVDVATWAPHKAINTFVLTLVFCAVAAAGAVIVWDPEIFLEAEPKEMAEFRADYAWAFQVGVGFLGVLAYWFLAVAVSSLVVFFYPSYYFRAGPGGLSVRVPNGPCVTTLGFTVNVLEFDMPWEEIERWWIVEKRPVGSLSRSCYQYLPYVNVKPVDGRKMEVPTDYFRESPNIIVSKIHDAQEMEVPTFEEEVYAQS